MTTALAIAQLTVARATADYVRGGMSYCQQFSGNYWEAFFGRPTPNSYGSAQAACNASTIFTTDWRQASPGDIVYFRYGSLGHVGVYLGSGLMASGTGWSTKAVAHLGRSVYIHRVDDYAAHLPLIGFSHTNGARARMEGLTDANAPVLLPTQRQVKPGADANIRQMPTTDAPRAVLKAGSIVTPEGFVSSTLPNGQPNGSDKWAKVADGYLSLTVFTDAGTHDLADLGVIPKPAPLYAVTLVFGPENEKVVALAEGSLVARPGDPERDEFLFQGWAVDGKLYDFSTPVTDNLRIEALWSAKPEPTEPGPEPGEPADEPTPGWWVSFWKAVIDFLTTFFQSKAP
jgi:hypothetical protein